jgi:lipopolysaccharide biosynthesis regulator YciM
MTMSEKKLCKWKKDEYIDDLQKLIKIVKNPKYVCTKCGRVAKKEKWLCETKPIEK